MVYRFAIVKNKQESSLYYNFSWIDDCRLIDCRKRSIWLDELVFFQAADKIVDIDSISKQDSPENFTFKRLDNSVQLFNLQCNEETGNLAVHKCIGADRNLHVRLYHVMV